MKKIFITFLIVTVIGAVGCSSKGEIKATSDTVVTIEESEKEVDEAKDDKDSVVEVDEQPEEESQEKEYYKAGEMVELTNEIGTYYFGIKEARVLPALEGSRDAVLQVSWEVNNKNFNGWIEDENGNKIDEGFVNIDYTAITVKDSDNYVLSPLLTGWDGDWSDPVNLYNGENGVFSHTYYIKDIDKLDYIYIRFVRLDKEFKIEVNK